ncbi:MAG: DNA replication/repair protein RecF [Actinomycetota bacterium]
MRVDKLVLDDFRNYVHAEVELAPGVNLVVGANAQGKTNLLEGVHCLGGLGSPRSADAGLVRHGCERALLHADLVRGERRVHVDVEIRPGRGTRALVNRTPVPRVRGLQELTTSVFFGPDDLALVKGSPDGRRRFVDDLLVKLRPARDGLRREWERVLKQRNALLKSAPSDRGSRTDVAAMLDVWDEAFARTGAALTAARLETLSALQPYVQKRYEQIAGGGEMTLDYESGWTGERGQSALLGGDPGEDALRQRLADALRAGRTRELDRRISLTGPQRDDVSVSLTGPSSPGAPSDARAFASQGDQRTCALALKLAEHELLAEALGDEPVLLLDDVFSELDPARRAWLTDALRGRGQTIVSSAEPLDPGLAGGARVLDVVAGEVRPRG